MAEFMQLVKQRRSVRKYENQDIPENLMQMVLESVQWAPSWANTQCWEVIVVRDGDLKEELQKTIGPKNPATNAIVKAPAVLAICGKLHISGYYKGVKVTKFGDWFMFDLGLAVQNLCLAAHSVGLGTVIVGLFDHDKAGKILKIPDGYEIAVLIPIGYPTKISKAPKRRSISEFTHFEKF